MPIATSLFTKFPLFDGVSSEHLQHLAEHANARTLSKREIIVEKGDLKDQLYLLLEGRLQGVDFTYDGKEVGVYFVEPGDYVGEMPLIDNLPHPEFVTALSRSMVISLPGKLIKNTLFSTPSMMESLCKKMAHRLRNTNTHRTIIAQPNPLQRVCMHLLMLKPVRHGQVLVIQNAPTHQELAIMLNASRETVTRSFQLLQSRYLIERDGVDLHLLNLTGLQSIATGNIPEQET